MPAVVTAHDGDTLRFITDHAPCCVIAAAPFPLSLHAALNKHAPGARAVCAASFVVRAVFAIEPASGDIVVVRAGVARVHVRYPGGFADVTARFKDGGAGDDRFFAAVVAAAVVERAAAPGFDGFAVLGVPRGTSVDDARRVFRALALVFHPDKSGGSIARMQELNRALAFVEDWHASRGTSVSSRSPPGRE